MSVLAPLAPMYVKNEFGVYSRSDSGKFAYSDGPAQEEYLIRFLTGCKDKRVLSQELLEAKKDWPTLYHVSQLRANLLRPLKPRIEGKDVLELGAGCGAITRYLGETAGHVTALEGSPVRARIAALRCSDLSRVEVCQDKIQDFTTDRRYDIVTLIGVLEYARVYDDSPCPERRLLEIARSFLKPDGALLLAIENRMGLKYLVGYPEDHVGRPYFGVHGCYGSRTPVTFGRLELEQLLERAGFSHRKLFVPLPDYKLPLTVIHPAGLDGTEPNVDLVPLATYSIASDIQTTSRPAFSYEAGYKSIIANGLLADLCNSFLYLAGTSEQSVSNDESILVSHYGVDRKAPFAKVTLFTRNNGQLIVSRHRLAPEMDEVSQGLTSKFPETEPYLPYSAYQSELLDILNRPGWHTAHLAAWAKPWIEHLCSIARSFRGAQLLPPEAIDMLPLNYLRDDKQNLVVIDTEWRYTGGAPVRLDYVLLTGLYNSFGRINSVAPPAPGQVLDVSAVITEILTTFGITISEERIAEILAELCVFQKLATGRSSLTARFFLKVHLQMAFKVRPNG